MSEQILDDYLTELSPIHVPQNITLNNHKINTDNLPDSYKSNNENEQNCLVYIDNFKSQYKELFPNRKPLLLTPINECNVPKFICSYICPTIQPYPTLNTWSEIAEFVADHLSYQPLIPSTEIPKNLHTTNTILKLQEGNCLEYSILLCSLLIGIGYDAYIINGYATRECCYIDQTHEICPYFQEKPVIRQSISKPQILKYIVKPIKKLQSNYELEQITKKLKDNRINENNLKTERILKRKELEKPKPDPLFGLRVHMWIYVKSGSREIKSDFFIEPFTGIKCDITNPMFLGIESIFNHKNYWFNKFCCDEGCRKIKFDLNDLRYWEPIFYDDNDTLENSMNKMKKVLVPLSFIKNLRIDKEMFYKRYPNYQKYRKYNRAEQWNYSPYFCLSGLIKRYKLYEDFEYENLLETHEILEKREDQHYKTIITRDKLTQFFHPGSEYHLKEYICDAHAMISGGSFSSYKLMFHENLRADGLIEREESNDVLEEKYINRYDNLESIKVKFTPRDPDDDFSRSYRFIECITKSYRRDLSKPVNDDIKEINFFLNDNEIDVKYHLNEFSITNSTRKFIKPAPSSDGRNVVVMHTDTHSEFRVPLSDMGKTKLEVYELLRELMSQEKATIDTVRLSEMETHNIMVSRKRALREDYLYTDLYDTIHNERSRQVRREMEEEFNKFRPQDEEDLDFLQPYLNQVSLTNISTVDQAYLVREMCLDDFRDRLVDQANNIKLHFEEITSQLHNIQMHYYQNKVVMSYESEHQYLRSCARYISILESLENLMARHKQNAPHKYIRLEHRLRNDPRLRSFLK